MSVYNNSSIVELVDAILAKAIKIGVSDIHFEPTKEIVRVRFRIDGALIDKDSFAILLYPQVVARCKVMAQMNSAQKRVPQDGKFCVTYNNKTIDARLSTFPSVYGEKLVIRILDSSVHSINLENLGLDATILEQLRSLIEKANGFFLVTGPTGSGKTTTLYAALDSLHSPERNIITLEDPVEYSLPGITQAQIHPDGGFTFASGIRSMLRQDPDIIMIGEVRDQETARTAIEAAMTGHMVLSTLHTNDSTSAIIRLMDMGIEPYLINASLTGILAQRLVRSLCNDCKQENAPTDDEKIILSRLHKSCNTLFHAKGCESCNYIGYKGRIGIFELLSISSDLRSRIVQNPQLNVLYETVKENGLRTLLDDAFTKLSMGIISLRELIRVVL